MKPNETIDAQGSILWDRPMLRRFKKAYFEALPDATFTFEGHEFVTNYAKYLIEYLEGIFNK